MPALRSHPCESPASSTSACSNRSTRYPRGTRCPKPTASGSSASDGAEGKRDEVSDTRRIDRQLVCLDSWFSSWCVLWTMARAVPAGRGCDRLERASAQSFCHGLVGRWDGIPGLFLCSGIGLGQHAGKGPLWASSRASRRQTRRDIRSLVANPDQNFRAESSAARSNPRRTPHRQVEAQAAARRYDRWNGRSEPGVGLGVCGGTSAPREELNGIGGGESGA